MKEITEELLSYKEALRHIWNSYYRRLPETIRFNSALESFERLSEALFDGVVICPLDIQESSQKLNVAPYTSIGIIPVIESGTPILINRSQPASGYWDDPVRHVIPGDIELQFIGFFDWDPYGSVDLRFYRVRIRSFVGHQSLVGRDALIETDHSKAVLFCQPA